MEDLLGIILAIGFIAAMFGGFQWIMAKYFGTHFHGKFQAGQAYQEGQQYKIELERLAQINPRLIEEAIQRCKHKKYSLTHYNVLSEASKIIKKELGQPTIKEKVVSQIKSIRDLLKSDNSLSKIEKLEKLNSLRKDGMLTENEFEALKKEIME